MRLIFRIYILFWCGLFICSRIQPGDMLFTIVIAVASVVVTAALWIKTMRPIDRLTLVANFCFKLGLNRVIMRRPKQVTEVELTNGVKALLPSAMMAHGLEEVLKFRMRPDDIVVATYAKAGTTWMQEIVWLICNDADTKAAKAATLGKRYGFLETADITDFGQGLQTLEKWPKHQTRFIKTHLPFELLPNELQTSPKGKMIVVVRNPKDNCVSFYHFHRMVKGLPEPGTWSEFLTKFCAGRMPFGSWFDHVSKYWQIYQERKRSMYFVSYEKLKRDLKGEVRRLSKFLEKNLTEDQIDAIAQHCTFGSMSKNSSTNYTDVAKTGAFEFKASKFMRKGEVGDWKNHFTINQSKAFDEMFEERTKDWTLKFEFEPA